MSATPKIDWWDRIRSWRQFTTVPQLSPDVSDKLKLQLGDLLPGQFVLLENKANGRSYAIIELDDLQDLLARAGMIVRKSQ